VTLLSRVVLSTGTKGGFFRHVLPIGTKRSEHLPDRECRCWAEFQQRVCQRRSLRAAARRRERALHDRRYGWRLTGRGLRYEKKEKRAMRPMHMGGRDRPSLRFRAVELKLNIGHVWMGVLVLV
jgi:hypothetical protein